MTGSRLSLAPPRQRGPWLPWAVGWAAGAAVIAAAAPAGLWFAPFLAGVVAGVVTRRSGARLRRVIPALIALAAAGWGLPLWWPALAGRPAGATARVIAALAGLPPHAAAAVAVTLLVAVLQVLAGCWLGRAFTPRPSPW